MIAARIDNKILLVLEPGNLDLFKLGKPLILRLDAFFPETDIELAIAYTPDVEWVQEQTGKGRSFLTVLTESLSRNEVHERTAFGDQWCNNVRL